jgi:hypothetical protein
MQTRHSRISLVLPKPLNHSLGLWQNRERIEIREKENALERFDSFHQTLHHKYFSQGVRVI